jgi:hypothetical protein
MSKLKLPAATALAIAALTLPATAHARVMKDPAVYPTATPPAAHSAAGFQWDDAGIGAATTVLLLGGGVLVAGAARRRRTPLLG